MISLYTSSNSAIKETTLKKALSRIKRSIWVFHLNTGSCNGCDIEVLDVLTPYFDVVEIWNKTCYKS